MENQPLSGTKKLPVEIPSSQRVEILLFAAAAEKAGAARVSLEVPPQATIAQVSEALRQRWPQLAELLAISRWAVNRRFVSADTQLGRGDEIALIPPVSGG